MKRILLYLFIFAAGATASAQTDVRFHNEASDTTRLTTLLDEAAAMTFSNPEARVAHFGTVFIGTPYVAATLEGDEEILTVNLDELDCTTFVETSMALAYTVGETRRSWRDYVYNLRRMRYRNGEVNGYPSRLHYICDWAVDNIHRGNLKDATREFPRCNEMARTVDFMSTNRDRYPALSDSANYARIRSIESGYRLHRFPYIKTTDLDRKEIKDFFRHGDVVALVSALKNLDVSHMGIVVKKDGETYLLHASSKDGKVEVSGRSLADFMKRNRQWIGVRVFRLAE